MKNAKKISIQRTLKALCAYAGCVGIAFLVMYLVNGTVGVLLITALSCALVLSAAAALSVVHFVRVELSLDKQALFKGETLICSASMNKKILIPAPMIEVYIECTPQLSKEIQLCRASLAGQETNTVKIPVKARYSGAARVSIKEVLITDYFGIFRFRLGNGIINAESNVSVYPNIPDVPVQTNFLKTAVLFSTDDDEEETNETALSPTGQPGYDYREYYPGDSIKRINWKLSSKKDVYMIRLDEKLAGGGQVFFLDMPMTEENEETLSVRDRIMEGMLAVFTMLVREGRETVFFLPDKEGWHKMDVRNAADIHTIQQQLANFTQSRQKDVVPPEIFGMGKTPICFTAAVAQSPQSAVSIVSQLPDVLLICASSSKLPHITSEMWILSQTFELKKQ